MSNAKKWSTEWGGRTLSIEVGKLAHQATASCTVQYGDTTMLATAVKSNKTSQWDYFPLSIAFEERLYAAGKIKGSRFIKREGRPSDDSILSGRVIDRSLRPLFDDRMRNEIQIVLTALSVDQENDAAIVGLIAASAVLSISSIPWEGPIGAVRVGRKNGELILNATKAEIEEGDLDIIVAGTAEKLVMVEAGAKEVADEDMFAAMKWGCEQAQHVVDFIKGIQKELGVEKENVEDILKETKVFDEEKGKALEAANAYVKSVVDTKMFDQKRVGKKERVAMVKDIEEGIKAHLTEQGLEEELVDYAASKTKDFVGHEISMRILDKEQRLDGRGMTEIRDLVSEVDYLPRVHGSAIFQRGDTQVLSVVTLGAPGDVQTLDTMEEDGTKRYMHHYNDAPYTYGETGFMRGPSRRAIGHGALAERALEPVLPTQEDFPYTIRVVSEVMGSNGSSSMASTCGSTLSLMAAGVPLTSPVAGIAMGLASDKDGRWKVMTDLQDVEDGKGAMDFKIAGSANGITAVQMDTKTKGLTWDIVEQTVKQSKTARTEILANMAATIPEPRADLSEYAPRIETLTIDPDKIRDVIGPGGKVINKIIEETGVQIDIEQDGRVMVTSNDAAGMAAALQTIKDITREIMAGEVFDGKVVRLEDFGAFVELLPGKDGLVHVSEIAWARTNKPSDVLNMGDIVKVKVKEIDNLGRVNLSMKVLLPKPEGYTERPPMDRRGPRNGGGRGNHRGGPRNGGPRHGGNRGPRKPHHDKPRHGGPKPHAPKPPAPPAPPADKKRFGGLFSRKDK